MAAHRIAEGIEIDGLRIGPKLHQGGMATIWEASRDDLPFPIVVKVPVLEEGEDPAAIVSFEMEQMILPRLRGPHAPRFVAAGGFDRLPFLAMERLPGRSLFARLPELPLPWAEVADIGARIARALDQLHRQHVVHLDVKPSNVILRPDGAAALIDYGLSRHDELPDLIEEEFRLPYGTAPYMAPEQVMGVRDDPASDLFALGVLMYFFATGERPFGDPKGMRGLKRRIWRDPTPPAARAPDLPPWGQELILRCLEPDPRRRHASAAQLAFDLAHPDDVELTERAERTRRAGLFAALRRRSDPPAYARRRGDSLARHLATAPIIAVAVDLGVQDPGLRAELQAAAVRIRAAHPGARVACLNVLVTPRIALEQTHDAEGRSKHAVRLAELEHWARPMGLEPGALTVHVIEAHDPAAAILDYCRRNAVDHVVMGARADSALRSLLGSVSGAVAAHAPCSVTVARRRESGSR